MPETNPYGITPEMLERIRASISPLRPQNVSQPTVAQPVAPQQGINPFPNAPVGSLPYTLSQWSQSQTPEMRALMAQPPKDPNAEYKANLDKLLQQYGTGYESQIKPGSGLAGGAHFGGDYSIGSPWNLEFGHFHAKDQKKYAQTPGAALLDMGIDPSNPNAEALLKAQMDDFMRRNPNHIITRAMRANTFGREDSPSAGYNYWKSKYPKANYLELVDATLRGIAGQNALPPREFDVMSILDPIIQAGLTIASGGNPALAMAYGGIKGGVEGGPLGALGGIASGYGAGKFGSSAWNFGKEALSQGIGTTLSSLGTKAMNFLENPLTSLGTKATEFASQPWWERTLAGINMLPKDALTEKAEGGVIKAAEGGSVKDLVLKYIPDGEATVAERPSRYRISESEPNLLDLLREYQVGIGERPSMRQRRQQEAMLTTDFEPDMDSIISLGIDGLRPSVAVDPIRHLVEQYGLDYSTPDRKLNLHAGYAPEMDMKELMAAYTHPLSKEDELSAYISAMKNRYADDIGGGLQYNVRFEEGGDVKKKVAELLEKHGEQAKEGIEEAKQDIAERGLENIPEFLKGSARSWTTDVAGTPVDLLTSVLAPKESGNPYANAIRETLGEEMPIGGSDWLAEKLGLKGEGAMHELARIATPSPGELMRGVKPVLSELITYHGTPHVFEPTEKNPLGEFLLSKIGTGEGAQAYGHGIYLAEAPGVAKGYRKTLSYKEMAREFLNEMPEDASFEEALSAAAEMSPERAKVIQELAKDDWLGFDYPAQAITAAFKELDQFDPSPELKKAISEAQGSLYTVDLPDEHIENMLDWYKPLSEQPHVQKVLNQFIRQKAADAMNDAAMTKARSRLGSELKRRGIDNEPMTASNDWMGQLFGDRPNQAVAESILDELHKQELERLDPMSFLSEAHGTYFSPTADLETVTGKQLYGDMLMRDPVKNSELLREAGIPGIKYLDQSSRDAGEGTRNFVVFDPSILSILKRE